MRILIVDDHSGTRAYLRRLLEEHFPDDAEIRECGDGPSAIARHAEWRPDWTVMDINLPELDGLSATRAIRDRDAAARIVIITGLDDPAFPAAARDAGACHFLPKDCLNQLVEVLVP